MSDEQAMTYTQLGMFASKSAHNYLVAAIDSIENVMGKGAAEKHPAIVAAMIQAASTEYLASMLSHRVAPELSAIASAIYDGRE